MTVASQRISLGTAAVVSAIATFLFPPIGAVFFVATTVYAFRQESRKTWVLVLLVIATLLALAAAPGPFLLHDAHGRHNGRGVPAGPAPAPTPP